MSDALRLSPAARPAMKRIGREAQPLLLIDDVLAHPEALVDQAAAATFHAAYGDEGGYPGIRAPAPLDYVERVVRAIDPLLRAAFGLSGVKFGRAECNFSLVTLPADALLPSQREPHVDTTNPLQFAILHYLCDARFGGTGFFRHRATGFEALGPERWDAYRAARSAEAGGSAGYATGDDPWFMLVDECPARWNRLVAYRSNLLHSGLIAPDAPLSADPRHGRLTANIFLTYRTSG